MRTILIIAVVLALGGCGAGPDAKEGLTVVATTNIMGEMVERVAGDEAAVEVLMPAGADPHDFQASSQQVAAMATADLVVSNGLGLEEGLHDVLAATEADGVPVLAVAPLLDPIRFGDAGPCDPSAAEPGECDPHVWMDPVRMGTAARAVAAELTELEPDGGWEQRAMEYAGEMADADQDIEEILASVPPDRRRLVTNHDTLGYFADRYGFEVIGTVVPGGSTLGDPSSEELARLVDLIRESGVGAIFAETIEPATLAEAVAGELGGAVEVVELHTDSLGEAGTEAGTLAGMLVANARLIAAGLG